MDLVWGFQIESDVRRRIFGQEGAGGGCARPIRRTANVEQHPAGDGHKEGGDDTHAAVTRHLSHLCGSVRALQP